MSENNVNEIENGDFVLEDISQVDEDIDVTSTRYQYSYVFLPEVIENPEQYIIPECLEACRMFWRKNIETFMVSNYDDQELYVLVCNLSDNNEAVFKKLMQEYPEHYFFSNYRRTYGIRMGDTSELSSENLVALTAPFKIQDTKRFISEEEFLERYKTTGGPYEFDKETFKLIQLPNPELENATLEDALEKIGENQVYVPNEHRIYMHPLFLKWHERYLELSNSAPDLVDCTTDEKEPKSKDNSSIGE